MARSDNEWLQDIIASIADIRADTIGMDLAAFTAKPAIVRSVLYSIAIMGEAAKGSIGNKCSGTPIKLPVQTKA